jgi:enoyl-CoA hydratase/carnithine racemase
MAERTSEHVLASREEGDVLLLRLARPEKKNALTGAMYDALTDALKAADKPGSGIGAVVLAGAPGMFTAGNDIADFVAFSERGLNERPAGRFIRMLARLETPLVAAVDGPAVGIGTTLTLHCDLVYAAPGARFLMPFVDLGLVPEAGSSYLLPHRVGHAKAAELLMLAEGFDAAEAHRLGLVNAVVPADDLVAHALAQARRLAQKPRGALAATRRLLKGNRDDLESAMTDEMEAFTAALQTPEAKAAFARFLDRPAKS